jgi:hypothetical protein
MSSARLRALLSGGDRRSIGRVPQVLRIIGRHPQSAAQLVTALHDADPIVRMRAADALEKASAAHPELLHRHTRVLLSLARRATQQELRWHLAQLIPRLPLTTRQRRGAATLFRTYLGDRSAIVRTFAMQALADLAAADPGLRPRIIAQLRRLTATGTPAMRARGRRLLARLHREAP